MTEQNTSQSEYDIIIIGAGPAGISAAATAAAKGLSVAILDEQASPGGQIYRAIKYSPLNDQEILGKDYYSGKELLTSFEESQVKYFPNSMVWSIDEANLVAFSCQGKSQLIMGKKILIATGATERAVPFTGWTLPGVMTCGAAQILLKTSGLSPATPLVIAGSGPLLLLIAVQLMKAGISISAILDTTPKGQLRRALPYFFNALKNIPLLVKGLGLMWTIKKSGVRFIKHIEGLEAIGDSDGQLNKVVASSKHSKIELDCHSLLVHQGVVPNVQLSRALNLEHKWDNLQKCWNPVTDKWGQSSKENIFIAGDGSGISGAIAATSQGRIAALKIAQQLNKLNEDVLTKESSKTFAELQKQQAIRPFLDQLYQPAQAFLTPSNQTIVCRCEEVSAGQIREIAAQGCKGPNQAKAFCRSGMGPCQGRLCGLTVSNLIAEVHQLPQEKVGYYNLRMPIKPLKINELADLHH